MVPENHFDWWLNRSAEQALNLVIEKMHEAWRVYKTLPIVFFDKEGAKTVGRATAGVNSRPPFRFDRTMSNLVE